MGSPSGRWPLTTASSLQLTHHWEGFRFSQIGSGSSQEMLLPNRGCSQMLPPTLGSQRVSLLCCGLGHKAPVPSGWLVWTGA